MNGLCEAITTTDNLVDTGVSKVDSELEIIGPYQKIVTADRQRCLAVERQKSNILRRTN
jgi:hypothetical protein